MDVNTIHCGDNLEIILVNAEDIAEKGYFR
jgi:hypothetical protein